jgi:hypothetical protein
MNGFEAKDLIGKFVMRVPSSIDSYFRDEPIYIIDVSPFGHIRLLFGDSDKVWDVITYPRSKYLWQEIPKNICSKILLDIVQNKKTIILNEDMIKENNEIWNTCRAKDLIGRYALRKIPRSYKTGHVDYSFTNDLTLIVGVKPNGNILTIVMSDDHKLDNSWNDDQWCGVPETWLDNLDHMGCGV